MLVHDPKFRASDEQLGFSSQGCGREEALFGFEGQMLSTTQRLTQMCCSHWLDMNSSLLQRLEEASG